MQVVIAHSHLNPGGVTRIIRSQVESLKGHPVKVLTGSAPETEAMGAENPGLKIFKPLNYLEFRKYTNREARDILKNILHFLKKETGGNSILHFHNLSLGKNPIATYAVYLMAKDGANIFNHAHDFAEDRPENLAFLKAIIEGNFGEKLSGVLYPGFANYHFGVLNSFDLERLQKYGIGKDRIEWLPNPVTFQAPGNIPDKVGAKKEICATLKLDNKKLLATYPVRVIRRKNIGELILLSVLFSGKANFVVTQPPKNPLEIEHYNKWVAFCKKEDIGVSFEAGNKVNFGQLLLASDFCITTSYREGFGMAYLEPWLSGTPVVGRDIDYITRDFKNDGFIFPALYRKLDIPGFDSDFKDLDIAAQMKIINDAKKGQEENLGIIKQNKVLKSLLGQVSPATIENNKHIIRNNYSIKGYGIKLQDRYKKMVGQY